jgi:hypothetical protein
MLTTYRLVVSLLFIVAIGAPGLRDDVRVTLAIAFAAGLVLVWHSRDTEPTPRMSPQMWAAAVAMSICGRYLVDARQSCFCGTVEIVRRFPLRRTLPHI